MLAYHATIMQYRRLPNFNKGFCGVAVDVAGELIKQEDQCEGTVWRLGPIVEGCGSAGDDDERAEVGGDLGVKFV